MSSIQPPAASRGYDIRCATPALLSVGPLRRWSQRPAKAASILKRNKCRPLWAVKVAHWPWRTHCMHGPHGLSIDRLSRILKRSHCPKWSIIISFIFPFPPNLGRPERKVSHSYKSSIRLLSPTGTYSSVSRPLRPGTPCYNQDSYIPIHPTSLFSVTQKSPEITPPSSPSPDRPKRKGGPSTSTFIIPWPQLPPLFFTSLDLRLPPPPPSSRPRLVPTFSRFGFRL